MTHPNQNPADDPHGAVSGAGKQRNGGLMLAGAGTLLAALAFLGGTAVGHAWGSGADGQQGQLGGPGDGRFRQFPGQGQQQNPQPGQGQQNPSQGGQQDPSQDGQSQQDPSQDGQSGQDPSQGQQQDPNQPGQGLPAAPGQGDQPVPDQQGLGQGMPDQGAVPDAGQSTDSPGQTSI